MSEEIQKRELEAAIANDEPFGPVNEDEGMPTVSAQTVREVLLATTDREEGDACLWLERVRVTGVLNLQDQRIRPRLRLSACELDDTVNLYQATATEIALIGCQIQGDLVADQLDLRWNLVLQGSTIGGLLSLVAARIGGQVSLNGATLAGNGEDNRRGYAMTGDRVEVAGNLFCTDGFSASGEVRLLGAKIGGQLSFDGATLEGKDGPNGALRPALNVDGIETGRDIFAEGLSAVGELRLIGAKIGGQLSFEGATLAAQTDGGGVLIPALTADGAEVDGDLFCTRLSAKGEVRLLGAKIGGQLSFEGANLESETDEQGRPSAALTADRVEVAESMFCRREFRAKGEIRMIGAKVGGQLSFDGATLEAVNDERGIPHPAFSADRMKVAGGMSCSHGFAAKGEVRLLGAKIGGQLSFDGATLEGKADEQGRLSPALTADRVEVAESMFCRDPFTAQGTVRFIGAKVGGQVSFDGAKLDAGEDRDDASTNALAADGMEVEQNLFCHKLSAKGAVRLVGARVGGQLALIGSELIGESGGRAELNLNGAEIGELIVAFKRVDDVVDLRNAHVRSLWDTRRGQFAGALPERLLLDGFRYEWLREPLNAEQRLRWIARSQERRHYPGVYAELAEAFRRIGHRSDARKVGIANERRFRKDLRLWSPRGLWHDFLWLTVGYGYRNWRAALWLALVMAIGAVTFSLNESAFAPASLLAPPFEPIIYAIDTTVPVLDLGQTRWWSATGCMAWVELVLSFLGYALVAAVIAAAAGLFNRDSI